MDGELVVWERDRLAFERLQQRLARRGSGAAEAARQWPAHYMVFDLVYLGADLTGWPYERRRAALEALFTDHGLEAPLTLCPSTTDPAVARGWLEWTAAGVERLCFKRLDEPYVGGARSWRKYKVRVTTEAVIGAVTGSLTAPRTVLLGRYDAAGRLQYAGRSTTLSQAVSRALVGVLAPPMGAHPWEGWTFSAGWGTQRTLEVVLVEPEVVIDVAVDVARNSPASPYPHGRRRSAGTAVWRGPCLAVSPTPWSASWSSWPRREAPGADRGSNAAGRPARRAPWSSGHLSPSPSVRRAHLGE